MAVEMKLIQDGPVMVKGECVITDGQGNPVATKEETFFLCRCGASANKPFCDGGHKRIAFKS
jgi:CDGSH-type Zn-finger protein